MKRGQHLSSEQKKIQEFSYAVSHDLGSAIRGVSQLTTLLEHSTSDRLTEKERYWMELIRSSAEKGQSMIDALSTYSRLVTQPGSYQVIDIERLIRQLAQVSLTSSARRESAQLHFDLKGVELTDNRNYLELLITSLLDNALQFHSEELGHVPSISIRFDQVNQCNILEIVDNGIGLTPSQEVSMTLPFKSSVMYKNTQNLGMGLTYCQRIAELSGGTLTLDTSQPQGLRVQYKWPIQQATIE